MTQSTPNCPFCEKPTVVGTRTFTLRRGDRTLPVELRHYVCPSGCPDPDTGEQPFRFTDSALGSENDEAMRQAWRAKYGEELPKPIRPGRKPNAPRIVRVPVLLSTSEAEELDRRRGALSRSEFLRRAIGIG